jgi:hypothetical protein
VATGPKKAGRKRLPVDHITLDSLQEQGLFDVPIQAPPPSPPAILVKLFRWTLEDMMLILRIEFSAMFLHMRSLPGISMLLLRRGGGEDFPFVR